VSETWWKLDKVVKSLRLWKEEEEEDDDDDMWVWV
jgi:hypothetical protein